MIIGVVAEPESLTSTIASLEAAGEARRAARDSRLMRARFEILRVDILANVLGVMKLSKGFLIPLRKGTRYKVQLQAKRLSSRNVGGACNWLASAFAGSKLLLYFKSSH